MALKAHLHHPGVNRAAIAVLLRIGQGLLLPKNRVTQHKGECNQQNGQTNTCDAQNSLNLLICDNDRVSQGSSHWVFRREYEWLLVDRGHSRGVPNFFLEHTRQKLAPKSAGNCVAKRRSDVVRCKVQSGDDSNVYAKS